MFQGTDWKTNTLKTAFHYPGIVFVVFCILNTLIWGQKSSGAVPFGTFVALFLMWFGISVPLVFVGCAPSPSLDLPSFPLCVTAHASLEPLFCDKNFYQPWENSPAAHINALVRLKAPFHHQGGVLWASWELSRASSPDSRHADWQAGWNDNDAVRTSVSRRTR
jgi:hypothetical protein